MGNKSKIVRSFMAMLKNTARLMVITACVGTFLYGATRAPEAHRYWLRDSVGQKVFMIRDSEESGGGTGFAMKAASGKTYIVTNDHVCGVSSDGKSVLVTDESGRSMKRAIIERSVYSDLCLVEAPPGVTGLSMGDAPKMGAWIYAVGHPGLRDNTLTQGEIIMTEDIKIPEGPISVIAPNGKEEAISVEEGGIPADQCMKPKNEIAIEEMNFFFMKIKVKWCLDVTRDAYNSNMQIQGGSSGSPVVDFWGNVIGVVFAGDRMGWGIFVSHQDLVDFLKTR